MSRDEIRRKFDQIVAFSEIESFIDMPVKLYSSGMRMRLAFSVAIHLEPDILLIDEALGVGDATFRAKVRQTIERFVAHGHTILLVSHDSTVIAELCSRAILLEGGRLIDDGAASEVMKRYGRTPRTSIIPTFRRDVPFNVDHAQATTAAQQPESAPAP